LIVGERTEDSRLGKIPQVQPATAGIKRDVSEKGENRKRLGQEKVLYSKTPHPTRLGAKEDQRAKGGRPTPEEKSQERLMWREVAVVDPRKNWQ